MSIILKLRKNHKTFLEVDQNGNVQFRTINPTVIFSILNSNLYRDVKRLHARYTAYVDANINFFEKYSFVWDNLYKSTTLSNYWTLYILSKYPVDIDFLHDKVCSYCRIESSSIEIGNIDVYAKLLDSEILKRKLRSAKINIGKNAVLLDSNKYLVTEFNENMNFIISAENIDYYNFKSDDELYSSINTIWNGNPQFMFGNFWFSDDKPFFSPSKKEDAKYAFIRIKASKPVVIENLVKNFSIGDEQFFVIPIESKNKYFEENYKNKTQ